MFLLGSGEIGIGSVNPESVLTSGMSSGTNMYSNTNYVSVDHSVHSIYPLAYDAISTMRPSKSAGRQNYNQSGAIIEGVAVKGRLVRATKPSMHHLGNQQSHLANSRMVRAPSNLDASV